jgi:hypothetical protein
MLQKSQQTQDELLTEGRKTGRFLIHRLFPCLQQL